MTYSDRNGDRERFGFPADTALPGWLSTLPAPWRPYAMLARLDRPVGIWLLFIPCLTGLPFQRLSGGLFLADIGWALLFLIGAAAMRGAGCTWNDITDRDFDAKVARTALRPIPSGAVSVRQAYIFLLAQLGAGFAVWLVLPGDAKLTALLALPLVAIYPFTKRVTWWPQAWLGLTFNWGVLVGAASANLITGPVYILYFGLVLWTIAYDTIYALQDREDDAKLGMRSSAITFGRYDVVVVAVSYAIFIWCMLIVGQSLPGSSHLAYWVSWLATVVCCVYLIWRIRTRDRDDCFAAFRANNYVGMPLWIGLALQLGWS